MTRLLLVLAVGLVACDVGPIDNGLMIRDGLELHPGGSPMLVACGEAMDCIELEAAVEWWASELSQPTHFGEGLFVETLRPFELAAEGEVVVRVGDVPPEALGVSVIDYDASGGIVAAEVTLQTREWGPEHLRHELGHCLGLDDDPPSLDLGSVMSSPNEPSARVTEHDRAAVIPWL